MSNQISLQMDFKYKIIFKLKLSFFNSIIKKKSSKNKKTNWFAITLNQNKISI